MPCIPQWYVAKLITQYVEVKCSISGCIQCVSSMLLFYENWCAIRISERQCIVWLLGWSRMAVNYDRLCEKIICTYDLQGGPEKLAQFCVLLISLSILINFQTFFTVRIRRKFVIISKDPTTPKMCCYTTLWNVSVLKQQLKTRLL